MGQKPRQLGQAPRPGILLAPAFMPASSPPARKYCHAVAGAPGAQSPDYPAARLLHPGQSRIAEYLRLK